MCFSADTGPADLRLFLSSPSSAPMITAIRSRWTDVSSARGCGFQLSAHKLDLRNENGTVPSVFEALSFSSRTLLHVISCTRYRVNWRKFFFFSSRRLHSFSRASFVVCFTRFALFFVDFTPVVFFCCFTSIKKYIS